MLKSTAELNKLPADSTDCFKLGMIDRYAKRPEEIKDICLTDFIARFQAKDVLTKMRKIPLKAMIIQLIMTTIKILELRMR